MYSSIQTAQWFEIVNCWLINDEKKIKIKKTDKEERNTAAIERDFNKAFCLLISKKLKDSTENFLHIIITRLSSRTNQEFKFVANSEDDYKTAIKLFTKISKKEHDHILSYEIRG